jgi:U4/U6 small nuclear ribonucleoprotein PRP3
MAETSNALKRPHPEDDLHNTQKRSRSNNGSPAPASHTNGSAMSGKPDINKIMAEARAKAAAVAERLAGARAGANGLSPAPQSPSPGPTSTASSAAMSRIEALKARVNAATGKVNAASQQRTASPAPTYQPPVFDDGMSRARGGLDVGLHPALMGDSGQDARSSKGRQAIQPKFATTMANRRPLSPPDQTSKAGNGKKQLDLSGPSAEETRNNPYFDASLGAKTATLKSRNTRQLVFNQKGKYVQQAAALRRQHALEQMKKRIAESSRKAFVDEDLDTGKTFLVETPPETEWWDEGIVGDDYSNEPKIESSDSIITIWVVHPVLLEPPQENLMPAPKPMFLTAREQAKLRRQTRMANLKEYQAKVRLGLEPPPPPKVKKANLLRVLGDAALADPTAVEARVTKEIQERADKHYEQNQERKLTKEEANKKLAKNQIEDAEKGIHVSVYKIKSLANGRHRFKVSKHAEQESLTGLCIQNPHFNLVIVEGGEHGINSYKKLMLNRIEWTENLAPTAAIREGNKEVLAGFLRAENEKGELKDNSQNQCVLVWEGEERGRAFRRWGSRVCETDAEAREVLKKSKMESFWTLAKSLN